MTPEARMKEFQQKENQRAQRVAICLDALSRIHSGQFISKPNLYLTTESDLDSRITPQEALRTAECKVCAYGAILASKIILHNKIDWRSFHRVKQPIGYGYESVSFMEEFFSKETLCGIELLFEGKGYIACEVDVDLDTREFIEIHTKLPVNNKERLICILENIVKYGDLNLKKLCSDLSIKIESSLLKLT